MLFWLSSVVTAALFEKLLTERAIVWKLRNLLSQQLVAVADSQDYRRTERLAARLLNAVVKPPVTNGDAQDRTTTIVRG
jgi:hypothetical protein